MTISTLLGVEEVATKPRTINPQFAAKELAATANIQNMLIFYMSCLPGNLIVHREPEQNTKEATNCLCLDN